MTELRAEYDLNSTIPIGTFKWTKDPFDISKCPSVLCFWIPCAFGVPASSDTVVVMVRDDSCDTPYNYTTYGRFLESLHAWQVDGELEYGGKVLYWMEMPSFGDRSRANEAN